MVDILIIAVLFSLAHLFMPMVFSLHKIPFVEFTYIGGDLTKKTELSFILTKPANLNLFAVFSNLAHSPKESIGSSKAKEPCKPVRRLFAY